MNRKELKCIRISVLFAALVTKPYSLNPRELDAPSVYCGISVTPHSFILYDHTAIQVFQRTYFCVVQHETKQFRLDGTYVQSVKTACIVALDPKTNI
jgi:hypothetical protein